MLATGRRGNASYNQGCRPGSKENVTLKSERRGSYPNSPHCPSDTGHPSSSQQVGGMPSSKLPEQPDPPVSLWEKESNEAVFLNPQHRAALPGCDFHCSDPWTSPNSSQPSTWCTESIGLRSRSRVMQPVTDLDYKSAPGSGRPVTSHLALVWALRWRWELPRAVSVSKTESKGRCW